MRAPFFHINAFADTFGRGNPAGVVLPERWPTDETMQAVAHENGFSETAFAVPEASGWQLRWFTPGSEVDLCGHATLATAHALMAETGQANAEVEFHTRGGRLRVWRDNGGYNLTMPAQPGEASTCPAALRGHFGQTPVAVRQDRMIMLVFDDPHYVRGMRPDMAVFKRVDTVGVIVTAPGDQPETDFISRFFAGPGLGLDEDPVTGSAHCLLTPYWAEQLGKNPLQAEQVSARGGRLRCEMAGDNVVVGGSAYTYIAGEIRL